MSSGFDNHDPPSVRRLSGPSDDRHISEIFRHVTAALVQHVRRLHQDALPVPSEVEELAVFLIRLAGIGQEATPRPGERGDALYAGMEDRLLVTKGEAAERLSVSVRTVERLVATGRLAQVHVDRLARFRVRDLEAYVDSLGEDRAPGDDSDSGDDDGRRDC
jgi:excisionase family DNA binding protein